MDSCDLGTASFNPYDTSVNTSIAASPTDASLFIVHDHNYIAGVIIWKVRTCWPQFMILICNHTSFLNDLVEVPIV